MLRIKRNINLSTIVIFMVSVIFSLIIGSGLYGYGSDFYAAYYMSNLNWGGIFDRLGWIVSTLTINEFHIGVHVVTFFLCISAGYLIREHIMFKETYSLIFFVLIYLTAIHTWPIIMSTSNAMRQGLAMSFAFMALVSGSRKNLYATIFFCFLATFMHKTGIFFFAIIIFSYVMNNLLANSSFFTKVVVNSLIGVLLFIFSYFFLKVITLSGDDVSSRIIGGDFRAVFIFIGFVYISLAFFYKNLLNNSFNLSLYYFSFVAPAFLMNGLNWQYERLGMMMLIPYILSFGILLNRSSYQIYIISTFFALLFLTFFTGMYASFE